MNKSQNKINVSLSYSGTVKENALIIPIKLISQKSKLLNGTCHPNYVLHL